MRKAGQLRTPRNARAARVAVLLLVIIGVLGAAAGSPTARADSPATAVLDWNKHAFDALTNAPGAATPGAGQPPPVLTQHLAMVQGAVYDAVNAIDGGHEPYLEGLPDAPDSADSPRSARSNA